ncbi:hypothetical protein PAAG_11628 [Paracoccidioides lutzii Pb01]|uniref:Uncharacterized protein n=1 Tax=Paracoccidioides lutzii (strain ATCC MYA-826 / Pb01) TaxID=502779 RepID=A0A0A2V6D6_PARBA|nr:hypothetical protein PAAG_11628 [Paracoccidioides lutzii Pb01]KGQ01645.1 hypothetical protein PAAG_11628 [Paracoccidioides lutzii Pb01]
MVSTCKRLHQAVNKSTRVFAILHGSLLASFTVSSLILDWVLHHSIDIYLPSQFSRRTSSSRQRMQLSGLAVAWNGVLILASAISLLEMLFAAIKIAASLHPLLAMSSVRLAAASLLVYQVISCHVGTACGNGIHNVLL